MSKKQKLFLQFYKIKRKVFRNYLLIRKLLVGVVLLVVLAGVVSFTFPYLRIGGSFLFGRINIFSMIMPHQFGLESTNGRTNILLLGIGDQSHDGPNLTDTMLVASVPINPSTSSAVALISVPRDIYLDSLGQKVNAAYAIGVASDASHSGLGLVMAKTVVNQITELPIHYAIRLDFSGFREIIDTLGGVDINVDHTLDDYSFPIDGKENDPCGHTSDEIQAFIVTNPTEEQQWQFFPCRYEHIHFDVGPTHMNGELALKFVRSRHGVGDEGTDFARSHRQELLLSALKTKILSTDTLFNPNKVESIYNSVAQHIDTDINPQDIPDLVKLALKYKSAPIKTIVLGMDFFDNPPIDERGWILLPKNGNWDEVHSFIQQTLESN